MEEAEEVQREAEGADLWDLAAWRLAKKKDNRAQHTASDRWSSERILRAKTSILIFKIV